MNDGAASPPSAAGQGGDGDPSLISSLADWWRGRRRQREPENTLREAIDELIEEHEDSTQPIEEQERILLDNILALRDRTMWDAMVPRADIVALEAHSTFVEVVETMIREGHSRVPVFRESLDETIGMAHIKDVLTYWDRQDAFDLARLVRKVIYVSPSMRVLELLLEMRVSRCHMALVVDEYGGIDGLVTIEDLVEEIVGEIEDEHDRGLDPALVEQADRTFLADARVSVADFEARCGRFVSDEEREDVDTLGGLVFALAGRVPIRGELITHPSGVEFEVLDADPRRIRRLRARAGSLADSEDVVGPTNGRAD